MTVKDFIEELKWRGMLFDSTPGVEEVLRTKPIKGYIGFDPTAPSLTIGNYVQVMMLKLFQEAGHQPVVLMGGATGRIGDPSFKNQERDLKSDTEIDRNLEHQKTQFDHLLPASDPDKKVKIINNIEFYSDMNVIDFLRDVGKTLTVAYMVSKESVKRRVETGLSFTEFSYQLLQAYDFQVLFQKEDIILQMGGSDQWGNITSGTEFIRRNLGQKAYAITTPLLTKADGTKFGKSEKGNIWLDPELTSPYEFYQFWLNADDNDIEKFLKTFSLKSRNEIQRLIDLSAEKPREVKKELARELTSRIHSERDTIQAETVAGLLFGDINKPEELFNIDAETLRIVHTVIPGFEIGRQDFRAADLAGLLVSRGKIFQSNSDLRRAIQGNSLSINKSKITDISHPVAELELLAGKYLLIESGKKNKYLAEVV